jgi:hypothetical protein
MIEDSKRYVLELNAEEIQTIKSALLFYSYEFVNCDYTHDSVIENKQVTKNLISKFPGIKSKNVYIYKSQNGDLINQLSEFTINSEDALQDIKEIITQCPELLNHNHILPVSI